MSWLILGAFLPLQKPALAAQAAAETSAPTFDKDVAPILQKNCLACHSGESKMGGFTLSSYSAMMKGGKHGEEIEPHKPESSRLVQMLEGQVSPRMPFGGDPLPAAEIATIKAWIAAGAAAPVESSATQSLAPEAIPVIKPAVPVVSPVSAVEFSPDGKILAIGGYQQVRLLNGATGKPETTLTGEADYVRSIAFSPDGKLLAAAGGRCQREGEVKIWDVASRHLVNTITGHKDCIYSVAWSPDGKVLATGSYDKMVKLWDPSTGKELRNLQDHIDAVFAVAFSPDGKYLASASQDRTVKIWNVATGERLFTLSDASDGLTSLAYSPDGSHIAASGYDKTIYIWKLSPTEGHLEQSLIADEDSVLALSWSPDGKTIITASADGSVRIRDAATLNPVQVIGHQADWPQALGISPDGRTLAVGLFNGAVSLYDAKTYKELAELTKAFAAGEQPTVRLANQTVAQ
jgi:WD40 repeat protein